MRREVPAVQAYAQSGFPYADVQIPLYFTVLRSSTGALPFNMTESLADISIGYLNSKYAGSGLQFYRLGNLNYLDSDLFNVSGDPLLLERYSYAKTAWNIQVVPGGAGFTLLPGSPLFGAPVSYNTSSIGVNVFNTINDATLPHELGHGFNLLHTFSPVAGSNPCTFLPYKYPVTGLPNPQEDHPYDGAFSRELAIRVHTGGKTFEEPNCATSGDFCCQTGADCQSSIPRVYPAFDPVNIANCQQGSQPCVGGCHEANCAVTGSAYRDYNADPITGAGDNIMSYHSCPDHNFTQDQKDRIAFYYNDFWKNKLTAQPLNINDFVEYRGSSVPMKNVTIRWRHPNAPATYFNSLSGPTGAFQGILYDPLVRAEVRKIGTTKVQDGSFPHPCASPSMGEVYYRDGYTYAEWIRDLNCWDAIRIRQHVLGISQFNDGYLYLAGDVNRDGVVTTFDAALIKSLLAGATQKFAAYEAPWVFVPEYIAQDHAAQFNTDPFHMTINGQQLTEAAYLRPSWQYSITNGNNGKSGYDGVKIGDVTEQNDPCPPNEASHFAFTDVMLMAPGQDYEITVKADHFTNITGFQAGLSVDHHQLEVMSISSSSLPEVSTEENLFVPSTDSGKVNLIWYQASTLSETADSSTALFKLKVKAKTLVTNISEAFKMDTSESAMKTIFFQATGCPVSMTLNASVQSLDNLEGEPEDRSSRAGNEFSPRYSTLYCCPNPVSEQLQVAFESIIEGQGHLMFYDMSGRAVKTMSVSYEKGINTLQLQSGALQGLPAGVLQVCLFTHEGIKTGKLVKL